MTGEPKEYDFTGRKAVDWNKYRIDLARPVKSPEPLIIQTDSGIPMLHRRNVSTIAVSAKVGKTFLVSAIAAAALNDEGFMGFHCPKRGVKVLFVDTEQDISDTQEVAKRVHKCNAWDTVENNSAFAVLNLREQDTEVRVQIIEEAIREYRPDLVLLDGIVDILTNFNDIAESKQAIDTLTRWATSYDCHIVTYLHVNKGKDAAELRGHIGSFCRQKGQLTLLLTKQEDSIPYIEVKPIDSRHRPIEPFCFRINSDAMPEIYMPEGKPKKSDRVASLFADALPLPTSMSYSDLKAKVMELGDVKEAMAKRKIKDAADSGIIEKNEAGYYHLPVKEVQNDDRLPF
ncbi:hypothetical protein Barb6_02045 [Bacteroidales bacterium Barb6]|nr:hypothetical protein Barb6_02045 [Bacteroidales bacterium Barb6]